jgi:hypothetical protein
LLAADEETVPGNVTAHVEPSVTGGSGPQPGGTRPCQSVRAW